MAMPLNRFAIQGRRQFLVASGQGLVAGSLIVGGTLTLETSSARADASVQSPKKKPTLDQLVTYVHEVFSALDEEYQENDVITKSQVQKLFKALDKKGWRVEGHTELLARVLDDGDFLVTQLSDEKGRSFLRKIESLPEGLDRLDRLRDLPSGESSVRDLIRKLPNGHEWIQAMTTTRRGERLGRRLSNAPLGRDFNEPTGRLYQAKALAEAIEPRLVPEG